MTTKRHNQLGSKWYILNKVTKKLSQKQHCNNILPNNCNSLDVSNGTRQVQWTTSATSTPPTNNLYKQQHYKHNGKNKTNLTISLFSISLSFVCSFVSFIFDSFCLLIRPKMIPFYDHWVEDHTNKKICNLFSLLAVKILAKIKKN